MSAGGRRRRTRYRMVVDPITRVDRTLVRVTIAPGEAHRQRRPGGGTVTDVRHGGQERRSIGELGGTG